MAEELKNAEEPKNNYDQPIRFSLKRKERMICLEDESGNELDFVLKEMNGAERDQFMTLVAQRVKADPSGKNRTLQSFDGLQASLLMQCMFHLDESGKIVKPVDMKTVQAWRAEVVNDIFEIAAKMNGLDKMAGAESKNE